MFFIISTLKLAPGFSLQRIPRLTNLKPTRMASSKLPSSQTDNILQVFKNMHKIDEAGAENFLKVTIIIIYSIYANFLNGFVCSYDRVIYIV